MHGSQREKWLSPGWLLHTAGLSWLRTHGLYFLAPDLQCPPSPGQWAVQVPGTDHKVKNTHYPSVMVCRTINGVCQVVSLPGDNLPQMDPSVSKNLIMCLGINWTLKLEQWMCKQTDKKGRFLSMRTVMEIYSEVSFRHDILDSRLRLMIETLPLLSLLEVRDKKYSILLNSSVLSIWIPRPPCPESRRDFSYPLTPQRLH